jgi:phospholipid/cholesterol/gamma-HCH transport system permease protein
MTLPKNCEPVIEVRGLNNAFGEQVGSRTTTAVVQSIFLVIVLDAVFAVFFSSVGWI